MFSGYDQHRLDTPPPNSRFTRPWSPDPYDPLPSSSRIYQTQQQDYSAPTHNQRREASDVSIEALDLADYARTLTRHNDHPHDYDPYTSFNMPAYRAYDEYPPSPPTIRPLASYDSLRPPTLLSPSASTSQNSRSSDRSYAPNRRPYSLPTPQRSVPTANSYPSHNHIFRPRQSTSPVPYGEIDIANFPSFARAWYAKDGPNAAQPDQPDDTYNPTAMEPPAVTKLSPFDPAYPVDSYNSYPSWSYSPPPSYPQMPSHASHSTRTANLLPWGADPLEIGPAVDDTLKEERIRMLEREFGGKGKQPAVAESHIVGSVNKQGRIITEGPKKRLATRWIQVLFALLAGGAVIYASLFIKPQPPAPPAGKIPLYVLYVLSVITFLGAAYMFLIYPSCCGARSKNSKDPFTQGPGGMMVLPVQGLPGGKNKKGGKKNMKGADGNVQVNLIVDPGMFGGSSRGRGRDDEDDEDFDGSEYGAMPGSFAGSSAGSSSRRRERGGGGGRRRGIFEGLAMEAQWKAARKWMKVGMAIDVVALVLWGGEFVLILLGQRCPPGGFEGWCDAYNVSTAAACLLAVSFGLSVFFDIKDLSASRSSPRTRT